MKGIIKSDSQGWKVLYTEHHPKIMVKQYNESLPLHPDDLWVIDHNAQIMGITQEVEFEIVDLIEHDSGKGGLHAKIIESGVRKRKYYTEEQIMEFTRWLAKYWMSLWASTKWVWEYQEELKSGHPYNGYKTEEELFDLFLKLKKDETS